MGAITTGEMTVDQLTTLRERLLSQSYLFDDADAYAAGVDDALDAVLRELASRESLTIDLTRDEPSVQLQAN